MLSNKEIQVKWVEKFKHSKNLVRMFGDDGKIVILSLGLLFLMRVKMVDIDCKLVSELCLFLFFSSCLDLWMLSNVGPNASSPVVPRFEKSFNLICRLPPPLFGNEVLSLRKNAVRFLLILSTQNAATKAPLSADDSGGSLSSSLRKRSLWNILWKRSISNALQFQWVNIDTLCWFTLVVRTILVMILVFIIIVPDQIQRSVVRRRRLVHRS